MALERTWERALSKTETLSVSRGGWRVAKEYSGDGLAPIAGEVDEIAVYYRYDEVARWPLHEVADDVEPPKEPQARTPTERECPACGHDKFVAIQQPDDTMSVACADCGNRCLLADLRDTGLDPDARNAVDARWYDAAEDHIDSDPPGVDDDD